MLLSVELCRAEEGAWAEAVPLSLQFWVRAVAAEMFSWLGRGTSSAFLWNGTLQSRPALPTTVPSPCHLPLLSPPCLHTLMCTLSLPVFLFWTPGCPVHPLYFILYAACGSSFLLYADTFTFASFFCFLLSPFLFKCTSHSKLIMPAPSSLPHSRRALSPEMHAITSEWISLTVGVPGRRSLAMTPPLPPLPEASVYGTDHLALSARAHPSLPLSLPYSSLSDHSTLRSVVSPLALPPPHRASSLAPSTQVPLHVNGDGGIHTHQDGFSQPPLGNSDRVISELSDAFSSQSKRQPWREDGPYERKAESEAGERCPGGPKISKKSCLKPSDVVRCLSSEQRLSEFHTPGDSQSFKPLGSPISAWEAGPPELHRGVEADRKAAQSGVSQVGLKHDRLVPWPLAWHGGTYQISRPWFIY